MPLYHFICTGCKKRSRKILKAGEQKGSFACECGNALERDEQPPSTQVMETLDNGLMVRKVERLKDAEALYAERARNGPKR